jgi:hypothetical protein
MFTCGPFVVGDRRNWTTPAPRILPTTRVSTAGVAVSQVRFQVLFGPASLHPQRMGWFDRSESPGHGSWYGWRLMGANNRELGRSARSFGSYPLTCRAVAELQRDVGRLAVRSVPDATTGRWVWWLDLDGAAVAASGRWYEREHDARHGAARFVSQTARAGLADGVVTLHERRAPGNHLAVGGVR